ncbi:hypothetical protein C8J57DRAFT_1706708 [Mycena rebaudengoi]|nr:hypothetical protein C8J57DRAFT_1706708 [Mycena rebaudengoi]
MTSIISESDLQVLEDSLLNKSGNVLLHSRFRALFTLKSLKSEDAVRVISAGFQDSSALLKHELAYCLGQMKKLSALPALESVLRNTSEDPMVRHEAAEAMGAISASVSLPILKQYLADPNRSIEWDNSDEGKAHSASLSEEAVPLYTSIDPAPPSSGLLAGTPKPEDVSDAGISP